MNKSLLRKLFPLGIVFLVIVFAMPGNSKFPYDYRKGREWKYETLFAEFDFPIYKTAEQMREERNSMSQTVIPYYKYSDEAATEVFSSAAALPLGRVSGATLSSLRSVYSTGVIADESRRQRNDPAGDSEVIYLQKDKRAYKIPKTEVYGQADAKAKVLADVRPLTSLNVDSLFRATGLYDLIVPNVLYDEQTTELVHEESSEEISPTSGYVTAGQLIVSEGELVTADIEQMLDSYKAEYEQNVGYSGSPLLSLLGNIIVAAALVVLLYFIIYFCCPAVFADTRYYYVLTLFTLSSVATLLLSSFAENLLFFVPYTLFAIMYQAFMPPKDIAPIYIVSLSPLLMSSHSGPMLFFIFAVSGLVMIFMAAYYRFPGLIADGALCIYGIILFALFKIIPVTLTLAGIAGFILSIGMAVDANILIFERTKEELKAGRTLFTAINSGFDRAFTSIFDSNVTTIISCIILYMLGTSIVKGFALTLALGVAVSMFTAITVTRNFMHLIFGTGDLKHPEWFGIKKSEIGDEYKAVETKREKAKFGILD